jgi:hypothetical protein
MRLLQTAVEAEDHVMVSLFDAMKIPPLRVVYIGPASTESPTARGGSHWRLHRSLEVAVCG